MKIAYFVCSRFYGGVEKIIVDTLNELCKSSDVALIVPKNCEFLDRLDKRVQIYEYQSYDKRYNLFLYLEIFKFLKFGAFDILHTHGVKATQIGFALSKILNLKLVATKHNNRKGKIFNRVKNIVAVSKEVANTINSSVKVIYFGINYCDIKAQKSTKFSIVSVGRLDKIKGFDTLINEVKKLEFDYELKIYGEGTEKDNLQKLINSLNLEDKVRLCGFSKNIAEVLANSHLHVISSLKEGFPVILIEGIFYSSVVISTPVGGIVEILDDKFLCESSNLALKISEIYKNYESWAKIFTKKHAKFKKILSFDIYIANLKKYYKEMR